MRQGEIVLKGFTGGINSSSYPTALEGNQYHWAINVMNRGGIVRTRPGFDLSFTIPGDYLQGISAFAPKLVSPRLVVAVDGLIYISEEPFDEFTQLPNIEFDPRSPFVEMEPCIKSSKYNPDQTISIIDPLPVLVMQDGVSPPAYWDGSISAELSPASNQTPIGLWMAWVSSRLWVASGSKLLASDIANPLDFREATYLAERDAFELPGEIIGVKAGSDLNSLLVFTESTVTRFKSFVLARADWATTVEFQKTFLTNIGSISGRSIINQYGLTKWYSQDGWIDIDSASYSQNTSVLLIQDHQMMRSKHNLSPWRGRICATSHENLALVSVPSGDIYNAHTWVNDQDVNAKIGGAGYLWASAWTGLRPVQWTSLTLNDEKRVFVGSIGENERNGTRIHVFEAFRTNDDTGTPIKCQWETLTVQPNDEELSRFFYAEIDVVEIVGDVDLKIYVAGLKAGYFLILDTHLQAEEGSLGAINQQTIDGSTVIQDYAPQERTIPTNDFSPLAFLGYVPVEKKFPPNIDAGFSLLFEWTGRMGIREVRIFTKPEPEFKLGKCPASESGAHNIVTISGDGIQYP